MFSSGYYQYFENRKIETSIIEDCGRTFVDKVNDVEVLFLKFYLFKK